jgi:ferritin
MSDAVWSGFIDQLNLERYSAEVYRSIAWGLDVANLVGFANYFRARGDEEHAHAVKFAQFLSDRNVRPVFKALPMLELPVWDDAEAAGLVCFQAALAHERMVTSRIHILYTVAEEQGDPSACVFLHWFITEQLEEEASLDEWITRLEIARGCAAAYLAIDTEMRG